SEYLPELKPAAAPVRAAASKPRPGAPQLTKQEIISLPPAPDNFRQTTVDPANPQLLREERALPNLVAGVTTPPVPAAATQRALSRIAALEVPRDVVAPAAAMGARDLAQ